MWKFSSLIYWQFKDDDDTEEKNTSDIMGDSNSVFNSYAPAVQEVKVCLWQVHVYVFLWF